MHGNCGHHELHNFGWANVPWQVKTNLSLPQSKPYWVKNLTVIIFYRVIGAIIVVAGLYLVVWGKSKDYASPSPSVAEKISPASQKVDADNNTEENFEHQAIKIDVCDQEIVTGK